LISGIKLPQTKTVPTDPVTEKPVNEIVTPVPSIITTSAVETTPEALKPVKSAWVLITTVTDPTADVALVVVATPPFHVEAPQDWVDEPHPVKAAIAFAIRQSV
jgi:hypothetical protein